MPDDVHGLTRNLIVIGGSAGGVEALTALVAGLPRNLGAAVCVVVHRPAYVQSSLADILSRAGPLPARAATQGARLEPGIIYVAAADHHLLVEGAGRPVPNARANVFLGTLRLTRGPKENRARPAVDPLFRSAALEFGPRVIAVVLSGALDDGTAGLWAVRDQGGVAVVQDPADATVPSMPASALAEVGAHHVARASELGPLLGRLVTTPVEQAAVERSRAAADRIHELRREVGMASIDDDTHERSERYGVPSRFACPDCSGSLWDTSRGRGPFRVRCTVGHAYSAAGLAEAQKEQIEHGLWAAVRALEDKAELARMRASHAVQLGLTEFAAQYEAQFETALVQASAVRSLLRLDTPRTERTEGEVETSAQTGEHGRTASTPNTEPAIGSKGDRDHRAGAAPSP